MSNSKSLSDGITDPPKDITFLDQGLVDGNINNPDDVNHHVDEISAKVDMLEQKLNVVEKFYSTTSTNQSNNSSCDSNVKDKDKDKYAANIKKLQLDAGRRETIAAKRMQDLIHQSGPILREEKRRKDEVTEANLHMQLAEEAAHAKMAMDLSNELDEVDRYMGNLRDTVLQECRRMSTEVGTALSELSAEDLSKALQIIAQSNPNFQASADELDLDMDAQSESTASSVGDNIDDTSTANSKHNKELCDALAKTSREKSRKLPQ